MSYCNFHFVGGRILDKLQCLSKYHFQLDSTLNSPTVSVVAIPLTWMLDRNSLELITPSLILCVNSGNKGVMAYMSSHSESC